MKISRIKIEELSFIRIYSAIKRRLLALPHRIMWNIDKGAKINRQRLRSFKDVYKGQRCFLIANGPSLSKTNVNLLKNEITFGLNRIYLNYPNMNFRPTFLVSINKLVLSQFADDFNNESMIKFFNWQSRKYFKKDSNTLYLEKNFCSKKFSKNISYSINPAATVTYAALQIIYFMGFKEVYIIGMDHSFTFKGKPNEKQIVKETFDKNHFSSNYFPKGYKWETPDLFSTEYFYRIANNEFKKAGKKIYDATIDGKCNIFDKVNFNKISFKK